jgi:hypothetical protein
MSNTEMKFTAALIFLLIELKSVIDPERPYRSPVTQSEPCSVLDIRRANIAHLDPDIAQIKKRYKDLTPLPISVLNSTLPAQRHCRR